MYATRGESTPPIRNCEASHYDPARAEGPTVTATDVAHTGRLVLRPLTMDDVAAVHIYANDPRTIEHVAWGRWSWPRTKHQVLAAAEDCPDRWIRAIVWEETGHTVGEVEVWQTALPRVVGLRCVITRSMWSRGIATESCRYALTTAFNLWDCHVVEARCCPENVAATRVAAKIGMTHVATEHNAVLIRRSWRTSLVYAATT